MRHSSPRYADWKAPADDGQMLIWPDPATLIAQTHQNSRLLADATEVRLQNVSLPEVRARARAFIGHEGDAPLIATGHQTELYHPGVWVKDAMINAVARKLGGAAFHFAVDTDAPKHLHVRWPGGSRPITDDDRLATAPWTELLAPPTPAHLGEIEGDFNEAAANWAFKPSMDRFFASLRRLSLESVNLASALTNSLHSLDWDLGLKNHALLVSPIWESEAYLVFVHHLMARAGVFAAHYNSALSEYRVRHVIRTPARPMPDLQVGEEIVEAPFWVDDLAAAARSRAQLHGNSGKWRLVLQSGAEFQFDPKAEGWESAARLMRWCREQQIRLAPRALTLTMYFRLFLADQFVHGIGGGRYDQVTDDVIRRMFKLEPPSFSVTTATLYFPAAVGQRRINLQPLLQEGRRIRHGLLSQGKRGMVAQIDALPRRSRGRQELFFQMHQKLASESNSPAVRHWEQQLSEAQHESLRQKALFDRELFYAIQPRERLSDMIRRYDEKFT